MSAICTLRCKCGNISIAQCLHASQCSLSRISKADLNQIKMLNPSSVYMVKSGAIAVQDSAKALTKEESKTRFTLYCETCHSQYEIVLPIYAHNSGSAFVLTCNAGLPAKNDRRKSTPVLIKSLSVHCPKELEKLIQINEPAVVCQPTRTYSTNSLKLQNTTNQNQTNNNNMSMTLSNSFGNLRGVSVPSSAISFIPELNDGDLELMFSRDEEIFVGSFESEWNEAQQLETF